MTRTIPTSICGSLLLQLQILMKTPWFPTWFANFGNPSPSIDILGFACYELHFWPVHVCLHTLHLFPDAGWVRRATSAFLFPSISTLSVFLLLRSRVHSWISARVSNLFPDAYWNTALFNFGISWLVGIVHFLRRIFLRAQNTVRHKCNKSRQTHHQIHRSGLCHRRTFSVSTFLPSLWHSTLSALLLVWQEDMATRQHQQIDDIHQAKKMVPLIISCEASFGSNVGK